MEESSTPQGEFHHFQLVDAEGRIPVSISVLVHYNNQASPSSLTVFEPISDQDIIDFHYALKGFDGNYNQAFSAR